MTETIRIGLLGAGRIGQLHAENLAFRVPGATLRAVADINVKAAEACAQRCHIDTVAKDERTIIEHREIDAILICSSTDSHARQIIAAAECGKHIFCEKPIALDIKEIDLALEAVEKAGVKLQVGFNRRFDPGFARAFELIQAGKIGTPHMVRITSRDPQPPTMDYLQRSGGLFLDMTIHDFDMARWIIGKEVEEIFAMTSVLIDPAIGELGDIDTAVISLKYTTGALGVIDNSRRAIYGYDQRLEVFGSRGNILVANVKPTTAELYCEDGTVTDTPLYFFIERYQAAYLAEITDFIDCLQNDRPPVVSGLDGRNPVLMAMAARRSSEQNIPVRV